VVLIILLAAAVDHHGAVGQLHDRTLGGLSPVENAANPPDSAVIVNDIDCARGAVFFRSDGFVPQLK
jgi:hypothetical protein